VGLKKRINEGVQKVKEKLPLLQYDVCEEFVWHKAAYIPKHRPLHDEKPMYVLLWPSNSEFTKRVCRGGLLFEPILRFVYGYCTNLRAEFANRHVRRVKVALIDTGVIAVDLNARASKVNMAREASLEVGSSSGDSGSEGDISPAVGTGESFIDNDDLGTPPWHYSEDEHGTQMAHLIRALDPRCELVVARVGDRHCEITSANLAAVSTPIYARRKGRSTDILNRLLTGQERTT
jgi:hypothetical protein